MTTSAVITPDTGSEFAELADSGGTLCDKHTLSVGPLRHPATGRNIDVTPQMLDQICHNFDAGEVGPVSVQLADDKNQHSESPLNTAGRVTKVWHDGKRLFTRLEVKDPKVAEKLRQGLIPGSSAMLSLNYSSAKSGRKVGATLLHQALCVRPWIADLGISCRSRRRTGSPRTGSCCCRPR